MRKTFIQNIALGALSGALLFSTNAQAVKFWKTFDPVSGVEQTIPVVFTSHNLIVGQYITTGYVFHGFIRASQGPITTFDLPGAYRTYVTGINDTGNISGYGYATDGAGDSYSEGFIRARGGTFTTFRYDWHKSTYAQAINNAGTVAGDAVDDAGGYAFLRTRAGKFTAILPGYNAHAVSINNAGVIAGRYSDGMMHGFVRDSAGGIVTFDPKGSLETHPLSINDNGVITGYFYDDNLATHGFLRTPEGTIINFDAPGAGSSDYGQGTTPMMIDSDGNIVGCAWDSNYVMHGFVRDTSGTTQTIDAPGASTTCVNAIGPHGKLAGQSDSHGFRAYPHTWQQ